MARLRQWAKGLDLTGHAVSYHVLEASDVAQALVRYAASNHVGMMILGAATHGLQAQQHCHRAHARRTRRALHRHPGQAALPFEQLGQTLRADTASRSVTPSRSG